jgi:hypothetical protein
MTHSLKAVAALVVVSCNLSPPPGREGPTSFRVVVTGESLGSASDPLPFSESGGIEFDLAVAPVGGSFDGWVTVSAEPGLVTGVSGTQTSGNHARLALAEGEEATLGVTLVLAYGSTRLWVTDAGYAPSTGTPACADGEDNDGDGLVDAMQDPGCVDESDGSEEGGSYIVGVSNELVYANPRIADVQGNGAASPLEGRAVTIDRGRLVVTRISTEGFYVTDVDGPSGRSNSLYVYNYSTPWGLRECDVVTNLAGIVGEFYGYTELQFPSWDVVDPAGRVPHPGSSAECPIPDPVILDAALADDWWEMEDYEAGLARIVDGRIGDTFMDCDLDGNGIVDFDGREGDCKDNCDNHPECTEITQYFRYGQYSVVLDGCRGSACTAVSVVTRDVLPNFWADHHADMTIPFITGTVRHLSFGRPPWILEARCADDLVCGDPYCGSGELLPMYEACVPPYARGQHYDDN